MSNSNKILVVEDEFITAADLISNLENMGYTVPGSTAFGEEVFDLAALHRPDLILMDINLKGAMNGITAAEAVTSRLDIPVVFLTGQSDEATINKAIASEPFGYIVKPFDDRTLKTTIAMALYKHSMELQVKNSEIRYRQIAESSNDLIIILQDNLTIEYFNQACLTFSMKSSEQMKGAHIHDCMNLKEPAAVEESVQEAFSSSSTVRKRIQITISGKEYWFDSSFTVIPGINSDKSQVLWIARDVTDIVNIQKAIEKEGIQQIEKNMEQFQILNDQIRNPLTIIASIVSLDETPNTDKILEQVQKIDDLVTRLDRGWIESNKVRSFLLRHFKHGANLEFS